jgi:flagellar biosynthesis protein
MNNQTNSEKRAVAIKYNDEHDDVPVLLAIGEGNLAKKFVSAAEESGVPIVANHDTATLLSKVSIGDAIPESMYEVVARVLLFVSDVTRRYGNFETGYKIGANQMVK